MAVRIREFTVHTGGKTAKVKPTELRTGCVVPDSGIYRVIHSQHRLPSEVTLIANQSFPRCSKCAEPVNFELVRSAPDIGIRHSGFKVALYELPEVTGQDESLAG
jgi:hypothetical protein